MVIKFLKNMRLRNLVICWVSSPACGLLASWYFLLALVFNLITRQEKYHDFEPGWFDKAGLVYNLHI